MVHLIENLENMSSIKGPLHLALGVFDGIHIGHQAVIAQAVDSARRGGGTAGVLTFEPHPIRVIAPHLAPSRILASLNHKRELLSDLGVDVLVVIRFTKEFASVDAEKFLLSLLAAAPEIKSLSCGEDWKFGKKRKGDVAMIRQFGATHSIEVKAVEAVILDGERVSSTRIRQAIRDGNMLAARNMLGREYTVLGTVIEGRKLGRQLGFPTANLRVYNEQLPCDGVWHVEIKLSGHHAMKGVANLGLRPTVEGAKARRLLEIHILDFAADIYGCEVEVRFLNFVRKEKKFTSLEDLQRQIESDVAFCRKRHEPLESQSPQDIG